MLPLTCAGFTSSTNPTHQFKHAISHQYFKTSELPEKAECHVPHPAAGIHAYIAALDMQSTPRDATRCRAETHDNVCNDYTALLHDAGKLVLLQLSTPCILSCVRM